MIKICLFSFLYCHILNSIDKIFYRLSVFLLNYQILLGKRYDFCSNTPTTFLNPTLSFYNILIFNRLYCSYNVGSLLERCWNYVGISLECYNKTIVRLSPNLRLFFCSMTNTESKVYSFQQSSNMERMCQFADYVLFVVCFGCSWSVGHCNRCQPKSLFFMCPFLKKMQHLYLKQFFYSSIDNLHPY